MLRFDIINHFIKKYNFKNYLEIGVFDGSCITKVIAEHKDGVDPGAENIVHPDVNYKMTSDEFFDLIRGHDIKYDIIFIDGLHHTEQVDKDIENSINHLVRNGVIILHDCNPPTEGHSLVPRQQQDWNGDVYKSILKYRIQNVNTCFTIDTDWGCGVIIKDLKDYNNNIDDFRNGVDNWDYFDRNRKYLLNLIDVETFKQKY